MRGADKCLDPHDFWQHTVMKGDKGVEKFGREARDEREAEEEEEKVEEIGRDVTSWRCLCNLTP